MANTIRRRKTVEARVTSLQKIEVEVEVPQYLCRGCRLLVDADLTGGIDYDADRLPPAQVKSWSIPIGWMRGYYRDPRGPGDVHFCPECVAKIKTVVKVTL